MSQRHPLALVAGIATVLGSLPLISIFKSYTWLIYVSLAVAAVVGAGMATRTLRAPLWAQVIAMSASLLLYLTVLFPSGQEILRIIPTSATFEHFNELFVAAGQQIRDEAIPVPDLDGLLLLTTAGVGLVAIVVDVVAVGLRRPALAGLPMLAIYSVPVAVVPEGLPPLPFGIAAAGYLWLLMTDSVDRVRRFGRRFTGDGRDVDLWEPSPLSAAGRRLGVVGVVIAMLFPLAVPGMTAGIIDTFSNAVGTGNRPGGPGGVVTGQGVDLFALLEGNLVQDREFPMVRVRTNDPSPYYLRFGVADEIGRNGFVSRAPSGSINVTRPLPEPVLPEKPGVTYAEYQATIDVVGLDMRLAPIYQQLVAVNGLSNAWYLDESTTQVFARRENINGKRYQVTYVRVNYTPEALRTAGPIPREDLVTNRLVRVPPVPEVTALVSDLTRGRTTQYDRVRAIYEYFRPDNGFQYSTQTEPGTSGNAIVDFLENKRGFCVQYAAALAWLVRAAGYPARVAFGFTLGTNRGGGLYEMTNLNLHAWTEVFFPDFGWVPFDATPSAPLVGSAPTPWAPDLETIEPSQPVDPGEIFPTDGPRPTISPQPGDQSDPGLAGPVGPRIGPWPLAGAGIAAGLLAFLCIPALSRRALRRRRRPRSGGVIVLGTDTLEVDIPRDQATMDAARRDAHAAWAELIDTMVDYDVPVDPSETPRATAARLGSLLAPYGGTLLLQHTNRLALAEERARYARIPLAPNGLMEALATVRSAIAVGATRKQRIIATLWPPSVLQRWRAGIALGFSRVVRSGGRLRDRLAAASPRRLVAR